MAGDWMKIELELPDKPEIHAMAGMLQIDPDAVVGKLIRVWQWFDKHTTDGNAHGVTYSLLDRISNVTGFSEAMVFVGWLEQKDKILHMPNFDRHTSQSAKTRATTQKRVAKSRNGQSVTKTLPEKRREEKSISNTNSSPSFLSAINSEILSDYVKVRKAKRAGEFTETAFNSIVKEAQKVNLTIDEALSYCCKRGWVGFESSWYLKDNPITTAESKPEWMKDML